MSAPRRVVETVHFRGPAGALEGLWSDPDGGEAAAVICHPHPAHGGSMHSKVVHTVYRVLEERGHPTLRFNFRGVGLSEGAYEGWDAAVGDVAAAAAEARARSGRAAVDGECGADPRLQQPQRGDVAPRRERQRRIG